MNSWLVLTQFRWNWKKCIRFNTISVQFLLLIWLVSHLISFSLQCCLSADDNTGRGCRTRVGGLLRSILRRCRLQCQTTEKELEEHCQLIRRRKGTFSTTTHTYPAISWFRSNIYSHTKASNWLLMVIYQTLSSLALVFALHHYKPTPLYVMDEIDAALGTPTRNFLSHFLPLKPPVIAF